MEDARDSSRPAAPVEPAPPAEPIPCVEPVETNRHPRLGPLSLALAAACLLTEIIAVVLASRGEYLAATVMAYALIILTVTSFLLGLIAVITGRGRRWGGAGMIVSVAANPLVAIAVLGFLGNL